MSRRRKQSSAFSLFAFQDLITSVTGIMILVTLILALELIQRKEESPPAQTADLIPELRSAIASKQAEIERIEKQAKRIVEKAEKLASEDAETLRRELQDVKDYNADLQSEVTRLGDKRDKTAARRGEVSKLTSRRERNEQTLQQVVADTKRKQEELKKIQQSNRVIYNVASGSSKKPWLVEISASGILAAPVGESTKPEQFASGAEFQSWLRGRDAGSEYVVLLVKPDGITAFQKIRQAAQGRGFDIGYDLLPAGQTAIDPETGAGT